MLRVALLLVISFAALLKQLPSVFADCGQHGEAWRVAGFIRRQQEICFNEVDDSLQHVAADCLRGLCSKAAGEDRQPSEEILPIGRQQGVAPLERVDWGINYSSVILSKTLTECTPETMSSGEGEQ